jgi:hypothetical protein
MRTAASAILLTMVMSAGCTPSGGDDRDTAAGSGPGAAGGDTAAVPAAPESIAGQPPSGDRTAPSPSGGTASTPPPRRAADRTPSTPAPPPVRRPPPAAEADTARGIAAVVGAVPITQVVLRPPGGRSITLTGPLAREIGVASGADVWVSGRRIDARTFEVASYAVRSVDGVTAITGTLVADGDRLVLVADDGRRHPIARPPAPLRAHVGARVWITGDLGTTINAYGVLRPQR